MLEKAKAHFKQILDSEGLQCIDVPEWGDKNQPAKIYFKPMAALPVKTYSRLVELGSQQTVEAFLDILILRCLDEQGKPLFKAVDKTEMLREISPLVVCDIIRQMGEAEKETVSLLNLEIVEKNS
jgi:hypothetical protein